MKKRKGEESIAKGIIQYIIRDYEGIEVGEYANSFLIDEHQTVLEMWKGTSIAATYGHPKTIVVTGTNSYTQPCSVDTGTSTSSYASVQYKATYPLGTFPAAGDTLTTAYAIGFNYAGTAKTLSSASISINVDDTKELVVYYAWYVS